MEDEGWWWVSAKMKQFWQQLRAQSLLEVQHCFRQQLPDCGDVSPPYCSTSTACRVEMSASGSHVACLVRPTHSPLTSPQSFSSSSFFFSSFSSSSSFFSSSMHTGVSSASPRPSLPVDARYAKPVHGCNAQDAALPPIK